MTLTGINQYFETMMEKQNKNQNTLASRGCGRD
jgi:hypothetical protein